jgi:hypothetical protein
MEMSFDDNAPVKFEGRVAFCSQVANAGRLVWHMGIEFLEMPPADLARLDTFLKLLAKR